MIEYLEREYEGDRHGVRIGAAFGPAWSPDNPDGFRAYARVTRYSTAPVQWVTNVLGWRCWFKPVQYRIYLAVLARLAKGDQLSISGLVNDTGASRSHVSKTLKRLAQLRFIDIVAVVRGRIGGITARLTKRLRQMFPPPTTTIRGYGYVRTYQEETFSAWRDGGSLSDWVRAGMRPAG